MVPVVSERSDAAITGPLPPEVLELLARYRSEYAEAGTWDDALVAEGIDDLRFLLERGPRATPSLHRYLALVAQLWVRAQFVETYFPARTTRPRSRTRTGRASRTRRSRCSRSPST